MADEGASPNELMLAACRNDSESTLEEIFEAGEYDIGFTDGAGNTAAHIAAKFGSLNCLELLVNLDDIDLDAKNRMDGNTPLHYAVEYQTKDPEYALAMVDLLIQGGADTKIENRRKETPAMLVLPRNKDISDLLNGSSANYQMDDADIANDDDDYGSDDGEASD
ncbi:ankyrin [Chlamydoabsidia padenii]|nr:ankyrin [Chlamydoabsidia padenii]